MRVLLVDVDSKIPNLALMKLSAWHKRRGDTVGFRSCGDPHTIYISVIYKRNLWKVEAIRAYYPAAEIHIGGPAVPSTKLPNPVENMKPDYDLYPSAYSMGYTTRGCIRTCEWCIVPDKEGGIQEWHHPRQFHDDQFDTIMLLDNNWLAAKDWFFKTSDWILKHGLTVWEHGLDIRLVDREIGEQLLALKMKKGYHFAFDEEYLKPVIHEKVTLLRKLGFDLRRKVQFYVYIDSDAQYESGLRRCQLLKAWGTNAYVMFNIDQPRTHRIKRLQRWANRKWLYWSSDEP